MAFPIPPSAGMKGKIRDAHSPRNASSPRSGGGGNKRGPRQLHSSTWLWLTGVCLVVNIGLMVILFVFHAQWMPRATSSVMKYHAQNRHELWKLMRGDHLKKKDAEKENQPAAEEKAAVRQADNEASSTTVDLPYNEHNSPNNPDYDLSKQEYHVIFSTGCSKKQHWQSYMLYYSIITSRQTGQVTRIASGCTAEEAAELAQIHKTQIEPMGMLEREGSTAKLPKTRFHLHMTPEFGKDFHYNNKPYGVAHWLENVMGYSDTNKSTKHDNTILFLLDPDMLMMRPFVNDFTQNEMWVPRTSYDHIDRVMHGYPMASEYGYGNQWFTKTKIDEILPDNPVTKMTKAQIDENYHAGPPYVATAKDFYRIVTRWRSLAQPIHDQYPYLLSEMFAYSMAAAVEQLPHQLARSFMVSDWKEEGLDLVTKRDPPLPSEKMCRNVPVEFKPHVLHYCQRLALGKYLLSKHKLPDIFVGDEASCQHPLLKEPPEDVTLKYDFFIDANNGERFDIRDSKNGMHTQQEKINQAAFMLCQELESFNKAGIYYKENHCDANNRNMEKTWMLFDSTELTDKERQQEAKIV